LATLSHGHGLAAGVAAAPLTVAAEPVMSSVGRLCGPSWGNPDHHQQPSTIRCKQRVNSDQLFFTAMHRDVSATAVR